MAINERTINGYLLQALLRISPSWKGLVSVESSGVFENSLKQPDLLLTSPGGNPVVVETEFVPARSVDQDAMDRLDMRLANQNRVIDTALAVKLPRSLSEEAEYDHSVYADASYEFALFSKTLAGEVRRWPNQGYSHGNLYDLASSIDNVSVSDRQLEVGANAFESAVRRSASELTQATKVGATGPEIQISRVLKQEAGQQTTFMGMAILTNAIVFQQVMESKHVLVNLPAYPNTNRYRQLLSQWQYILNEINYFPIYSLARDLLDAIGSKYGIKVVETIQPFADELTSLGTTTLYDLSGRMFQTLIADRKFLATYYTLPSSSVLLAELAVRMLSKKWNESSDIPKTMLADLACGTGTLLSAAYRCILRNYQHYGKEDSEIHAHMLENCVIGADIMPAAVHMAASQLISFHTDCKLKRNRVYTMLYGKQDEKLGLDVQVGSLELLDSDTAGSVFGTGSEELQVSLSESIKRELELPDGSLDLVIMNPPFTRPTNHKTTDERVPSFAGLDTPEVEQQLMSKKLKRLRGKLDSPIGHGNAGIASNFCDLAHLKVKPGGIVALILPATVANGSSWNSLRDQLIMHYSSITVITIAKKKTPDRAFSADTGLAECLIIARRQLNDEQTSPKVTLVNLLYRPDNLLEATEIAREILSDETMNFKVLRVGEDEIGHRYVGNLTTSALVGIRSSELTRFLVDIDRTDCLCMRGTSYQLPPMTTLEELGKRSPVHRNIGVTNMSISNHRAPLKVIKSKPKTAQYPMLWNHHHDQERQFVVEPDAYGEVIEGREGRIAGVWETASRLHFSLDFSTNSHAITTCVTDEICLGGSAWPSFQLYEELQLPFLLLWMNSSIGILLRWQIGSKQHVGRSRVTITTIGKTRILDPRLLDNETLSVCQEKYDYFKEKEFLPATSAHQDPIRVELDAFVLGTLCKMPKKAISDFGVIRQAWCNEPIVMG